MKKNILLIYIVLLILGPFILLILPADVFDKGKSFCPSVLLLDVQCLGCGITRAIQHLIHFDFAGAAAFNKLSFIVLPILVFIWGKEMLRVYRKIKSIKA